MTDRAATRVRPVETVHPLDLAVRGAEDVDGLPYDQVNLEALCDRWTALTLDHLVMDTPGGTCAPS